MTKTHYVWDPFEDNVIEECDENGDTIVEYETEPDLYGNLISQDRDGEVSYYHFDGQGSTLALTDEAGEVSDEYAYTAFAEETQQSGTTDNLRRYVGEAGYQYGSNTVDYYVRERIFEPITIRWSSRDPYEHASRLKPYVYVDNTPMNSADPSGRIPFDQGVCPGPDSADAVVRFPCKTVTVTSVRPVPPAAPGFPPAAQPPFICPPEATLFPAAFFGGVICVKCEGVCTDKSQSCQPIVIFVAPGGVPGGLGAAVRAPLEYAYCDCVDDSRPKTVHLAGPLLPDDVARLQRAIDQGGRVNP